jgi:hypothetical protein
MIGLIISDTHILYGEWINSKEKNSLEDLGYIKLKKNIRELIKSKTELQAILDTALKNVELKDKEVVITIDDDLLFHDKFTTDDSISKKDILEYIQWETKQKWGELSDYYTTFAENDSITSSVLHSVTCPTLLISEIKNVITAKSGKPLWLGPISTIYLNNKEFSDAAYILDDDSFLRFFFRGKNGYGEGKLRFIGDQPSISVIVGDKNEQLELFSVKNDVNQFVIIDLISETKNSKLRQYRPQRLIPFEGVDVKIEDIPEDVSFKLLNVLSVLIKDFSIKNLINFFDPTQLQEKTSEDLKKSSIAKDDKKIEQVKTTVKKEKPAKIKDIVEKKKDEKSIEKVIKEQPKDKKKKSVAISKQDTKRKSSLPYLLIILIALMCYYIFFTKPGEEVLTKIKGIFGITNSIENTKTLMIFDTYLNQSAAILDGFNNLTEVISPDSIINMNIMGNSGNIEFVGTDSLSISNLNTTNYLLEPIECCGGIKQFVEFDVGYIPGEKRNTWIASNDVIDQLSDTFKIDKIRVLENVNEQDLVFKPVIFEINSIELLDKVVNYLDIIGDNVIVRKISVANTPPESNISATFYVSIFESF